jgi:hypothetical protein
MGYYGFLLSFSLRPTIPLESVQQVLFLYSQADTDTQQSGQSFRHFGKIIVTERQNQSASAERRSPIRRDFRHNVPASRAGGRRSGGANCAPSTDLRWKIADFPVILF